MKKIYLDSTFAVLFWPARDSCALSVIAVAVAKNLANRSSYQFLIHKSQDQPNDKILTHNNVPCIHFVSNLSRES